MSENTYSKERKELQAHGLAPEWMTTGGWQMFKQKYLYKANNPREQYQRIASTLAKHINVYPDWWEKEYSKDYTWERAFFDILWNNHLSPSTPVLGNTGTDRGCTVSCSGTYIGDNVYSFYENLQENAVLTQEGFGTSSYLGDIRPRGTPISRGGKASGILPVFKAFVQMSSDISQGSNRRGAWAGSVHIDHPDWDEVCDFVNEHPDDVNAAWLINDAFRDKLLAKDKEAMRRWGKALKVKMTTGKGYLTFIDKINRKRPEMYVDKGLFVKASQLCQEITLFSDERHSFTCVLSSVNAYTFRKWPPKLVFIATVFLDCVCEEFLQRARNIPGLEKAVRFTEKSRALGLGVMGLSSLFQEEQIIFGSLESMFLNTEIFKKLKDESEEASIWMAQALGEPDWCKGYGVRNTHTTAVAPTKSTALIMGGMSEGINIDPAMTFTQTTTAGEVDRMSPVLLKLMKEKGVYNKKVVQDIVENLGSVQHVDWLDAHEKAVFRTAFETDQYSILRLASQRQRYLSQMQSLNLFFSGEESEEHIGAVMLQALLDENILSVYYAYSKRGVLASTGECEACQ